MDRNTITGLLLIFLITIAWAFYTMPSEEDLERQRAEQARQDSIAAAQAQERGVDELPPPDEPRETDPFTDQVEDEEEEPAELGAFESAGIADTVRTIVRTPLYEIELTNLGAGPSKHTLLGHKTWDQHQMQMIRDTTRSTYSLGFLSFQNYNIETQDLLFEPLFDHSEIELDLEESEQLSYQLQLDENSRIVFTYTFYADRYQYDLDIRFDDMMDYISDSNVDFMWTSPLNLSERDIAQDAQNSAAYVYAGGELEKFQLTETGTREQFINGTIDWVTTRTRFFGQYIKPTANSNAAILRGEIIGTPGQPDAIHHYQAGVTSNIATDNTLTYEFYSGPLRYYDLREFDSSAYDVIEIGYALIRWFADPIVRFLVIPFFGFGSLFIANYGVLIILFGVIVKLVLFPLTQKSFKSMAAMKELQPQMQEIKEKYKDDPQKQQKETIALYKKAGVNPLGGCLPMLLQFPILITLFFFFQNSMLIRQEPFLWADDLSAPDYIINLPFSIPFLGDQIAGFVLLMTAAMFVQTKVMGGIGGMGGGSSPAGAPNMKAFTYILPFILLFVFNNFAAGLSLYYLVYNVLSVAQQAIIKKQIDPPEVNTSGKKGSKRKGKKKSKK
ncbi:membrane protein insertase YidC [Rhodohalobacter sp. SW132]|uniref:membrane protein insertase YidC n=1 Tax=Rhodohalobacter sp. SW132 TaxID=2293433 RepID=UPI000E22EC1A|nr:membrane protein insertase YidC [Rhodohalobacter sp. SW132]REL38824.1 membrane protein insertase YidC [Rhodohalobacter sp. SW132]